MPTLSNEALRAKLKHIIQQIDTGDSLVCAWPTEEDLDKIEALFATQNTALLKELLSELPEKLDMQPAIKTHSDAGAGTVIGHNHLLSKVKDLINSKLAAMGGQS